jgi:hypothetical protein
MALTVGSRIDAYVIKATLGAGAGACGPREDSEVFRAPQRRRVGVGPHAMRNADRAHSAHHIWS